MAQVIFTIPGEPRGKQRPKFARTAKGVMTYTPDQTTNYENLVKISYMEQHGRTKLTGAIDAHIIGQFPIPKSTSKRRRKMMIDGEIHHTKKIDCDNLAKIILDALNGIAYDDDKQVCFLQVEKIYSENPCVTVELKEVGEE